MISFADALKNSAVYNLIKHDIDTGNLSHAYMIVSPDGFMLKQLFSLIACAVYCKEDACLDCTVCNRIMRGNHADVKFLNESEKTIKVDDVEALIGDTVTKPYESDNKLYFVYAADKMNTAAQNKLLKTLEEPQKAVTIFLAVQRESAMLDTVKSRSKKLYLDRFTGEIVYDEMFKLTENAQSASLAAACCDGLLGRALEITESGVYAGMYDYALSLLATMKKSSDVGAYLADKSLSADNLPVFLDILSVIVRDMLAVKRDGNLVMSKHKRVEIEALSSDFGDRALANILYLINEERKKINFHVGNTGIVENLLFGILEVKYKCR